MLLSCDRWLKSKRVHRGNRTKATQQPGAECQMVISAKALGLAVEIKLFSSRKG